MNDDDDESWDALKNYQKGMEWAYKDTGRFRYEFTGHNGPKTIAKGYSVPIDHLLASGSFKTSDLPPPESFALAIPNLFALEGHIGQFDLSIPSDATALATATTGENMILPLPLIDICISAIGGRSDLTDSWLNHLEVQDADVVVAVERAAMIIGSLMAEAVANRLQGIGLKAWHNSWRLLAKFVDLRYFIEMLSLKVSGERVAELKEMRDAGDPILRVAMKLSHSRKSYENAVAMINYCGWPQGVDVPKLPLLSIETNVLTTVRPVGSVFSVKNVNPFVSSNLTAFLIFVIDRADGVFKILQLTKEAEKTFSDCQGRDIDIFRYNYSGDENIIAELCEERKRIDERQKDLEEIIRLDLESDWPEENACLRFKSNYAFVEMAENRARLKQITVEIKRHTLCTMTFVVVSTKESPLSPKEMNFAETLTTSLVASYFSGKKQMRERLEKMERETEALLKEYETLVEKKIARENKDKEERDRSKYK